MRLDKLGLRHAAQWEQAGFILPRFDLDRVVQTTRENPSWVHFGAGNIFRAFLAVLQQRLLDSGLDDRGIVVAEGYDTEIIDRVFRPHDNLCIAVTLNADGTVEKRLVASMTEALKVEPDLPDYRRIQEVFRHPGLQMVSFTITEKGYSLTGPDGPFATAVLEDFAAGPDRPASYMGTVAGLLHGRYQAGARPVAMVSMDNYSHNGDKLAESVRAFAEAWSENGLCDSGFLDYVTDPDRVGFPCTMIDKITPRPDPGIQRMLLTDGIEGMQETVTRKGTHIAPFVNAERPEYLVMENLFPNGHPPLDQCGVVFTSREVVDRMEKMKVSTCLNCLHLALGIFGCLLSFEKISDEMRDPDLRRMVEILGYDEGLPVAADPGIVSPKAFLDEVLQVRFPNPFVPDTPQRIALDCSQKFPSRLGQTILAYMERDDLDSSMLRIVPLVQAAWCRYLMAIDDSGKPFIPSNDPLFSQVSRHVAGIALGDQGPSSQQLRPILSDSKIFGVDLYRAGLGERIEQYFTAMTAGPGAVRRTLHQVVSSR